MPCAIGRRLRASRAISAPTRSRTRPCRCRSSGTTPRTSGAGSPKCAPTPSTSAISSASASSRSEAAVKISQVAVDVLRVPVDRPYSAGGRTVDANWHVLDRITTSDGIEGIGYIVYPRPDLMTTIGSAARELGEHLIGMSVLEPEASWEKLARRGDWVGPGGLLHCALAPLDIAVWDAHGKTLGQPLHRLLGGYRDRVPTYASDNLWVSLSAAEVAASAKQHVADGFDAVKLRIGKEPTAEAEAERVRAVRDAVGPRVKIMVDAVESWSLVYARRAGR